MKTQTTQEAQPPEEERSVPKSPGLTNSPAPRTYITELLYSPSELKDLFSASCVNDLKEAHALGKIWPKLTMRLADVIKDIEKTIPRLLERPALYLAPHRSHLYHAAPRDRLIAPLLLGDALNDSLRELVRTPSPKWSLWQIEAMLLYGKAILPDKVGEYVKSLDLPEDIQSTYADRFQRAGIQFQETVDALVVKAHLSSRTRALIEALGGTFDDKAVSECRRRIGNLSKLFNLTANGETLELCGEAGDLALVEVLHKKVRASLGGITTTAEPHSSAEELLKRAEKTLPTVSLMAPYPYALAAQTCQEQTRARSSEETISVSPPLLTAMVDGLIVARDFNNLQTLRSLLKLDSLPASQGVVDDFIREMCSSESLGECDKKFSETPRLEEFLTSTGIVPQLALESKENARARYLTSHAQGEGSRFEAVEKLLGIQSIEDEATRRLYAFCASAEERASDNNAGSWSAPHDPERLQQLITKQLAAVGQGLSPDSFIKNVEDLSRSSGTKVLLDAESLADAIERVVNASEGRRDWRSESHLYDAAGLLVWTELYTGERPPEACIERFRVATYSSHFQVGELDHSEVWTILAEYYSREDRDIAAEFKLRDLPDFDDPEDHHHRSFFGTPGPKIHTWLKDRYGPPSFATAQRIYWKSLDHNYGAIDDFFKLVEDIAAETSHLAGGPFAPDRESLIGLAEAEHPEKRGSELLAERFNRLCYDTLESYRRAEIAQVEQLEKLLDLRFELDPKRAQLLLLHAVPEYFYFGGDEGDKGPEERLQKRKESWDEIEELVNFIADRCGVRPFRELAENRYCTLAREELATVEDYARLQHILGIPPSAACAQRAYREIARNCFGEKSEQPLERIDIARAGFGVEPVMSTEDTESIIDACLKAHTDQHHKLETLVQKLRLPLTDDIIERKILGDSRFWGPLRYPISDEILDRHFSNQENNNLPEYVRVYALFRCHDYFQSKLRALERISDGGPRSKRVALLCAIAVNEEDRERYVSAREGLQAIHAERDPRLITMMAAAFAQLVHAGEHYMPRDFGRILRRYCSKEAEPGSLYPKLGYDELVALRVLGATNTWEGNKFLLSTVFKLNVHRQIRRHILRHLAGPSGSLPKYTAHVVRQVLEGDRESIGERPLHEALDELDFYRAIRNLASYTLSAHSATIFDRALKTLHQRGLAAHTLRAQHGPYIPKEAFVQVGALVDWDISLIEKFNSVYQRIPSSTAQNNLLVGIVFSTQSGEEQLRGIRALLRRSPLGHAEAPEELTELLRILGFVQRSDHRVKNMRLAQIPTGKYLDKPTVTEAVRSLRADKGKIIVALSKNEISPNNISALQGSWHGNDALIGALSGLHDLNSYQGAGAFSEVFCQGLGKGLEHWKEYRYRQNRAVVKAQLAHLTPEQRRIWEGDYFEQVANLQSTIAVGDPARTIADLLCEACRDSSDRRPSVAAFRDIVAAGGDSESPSARTHRLKDAAEVLARDLDTIAAILYWNDCERAAELLAGMRRQDTLPVNTKTKQALQQISAALPDDFSAERPIDIYNLLRKSKKSISTAELLPQGMEEQILQLGEWARLRSASTLSNEHWLQAQGFPHAPTKRELHARFHQLRELHSLCFLAGLNDDTLSTLSRGRSRELHTARELASSLADSPLGKALKQSLEILTPQMSRRAMLFTDDPFLIMNIGKCPAGAASCVNYESSANRVSMLPSYMADGHIKALILIDLERLPTEKRQAIDALGFEVAKSQLSHQDILDAALYRRIVRSVRAERFGAGNFMEPVYPRVTEQRKAINDQFLHFMTERLSGPMGIPTLEQGEDIEVTVAAGRFSTGQLEDRTVGNGRFYPMAVMHGSYTMRAQVAGSFLPSDFETPVLEAAENRDHSADSMDFDSSMLASVIVDPRTEGRGFRIDSWFDLKTGLFFAGDSVERIRAAENSTALHMIQVRQPSFKQILNLTPHQYFYVPDRVGYRLDIPSPVDPSDPLSGYFREFGHGGQRRRDINRLTKRIQEGELEFVVSRGEVPGQVEQFLELYMKEMDAKARGRTPLIDAIRQEGKGPDGFLSNDRIGLFLKRDGEVIAGLIAKRATDHYSISFAASDHEARRQYRQLALYLVTDLMRRSIEEGHTQLHYGSDKNLYGHHLAVGLAAAKIGQGFRPIPSGNKVSLIKFCNYAPFNLPVFFYVYGPRNSLYGVQLGPREVPIANELRSSNLTIKNYPAEP